MIKNTYTDAVPGRANLLQFRHSNGCCVGLLRALRIAHRRHSEFHRFAVVAPGQRYDHYRRGRSRDETERERTWQGGGLPHGVGDKGKRIGFKYKITTPRRIAWDHPGALEVWRYSLRNLVSCQGSITSSGTNLTMEPSLGACMPLPSLSPREMFVHRPGMALRSSYWTHVLNMSARPVYSAQW